MSPKKLDPGDDEPGTTDHHVERPEGLLLAGREPSDAIDQEFQVGLDRREIDLFRITAWHEARFIWHAIDRARRWLMSG